MADPLVWVEGEGYDIHVLRKGPASKVLTGSFTIDPSFPLAQFPLVFIPHFKGAPNALGVTVDTSTGEVTALAHPSGGPHKLRNFLMTARQDITGQGMTFEATIRVHVHDSVQKIWLTPSTLTIHTHDDECRFTVLALFDDGTVGDITDWPQLAYTSADPTAVDVLPKGNLSAVMSRPETDMEVDITATLKLTTPTTNQSGTAKAVTRAPWISLGRLAPVQFVDGPVRPNDKDVSSAKKDSVKSVVEHRTNILFIAEGFSGGQVKDFKDAVDAIVKALRTEEHLQPFKLLKDSVNYWSLFMPSKDDGISLLGDYKVRGSGAAQRGVEVPLPAAPPAAATSWAVEHMVHELGLPVPQDPTPSVPDAVTRWKALYDAPVTEALVKGDFSDWDSLRTHAPLNERDSLFGIAHRVRPRASAVGGGDQLLRNSVRRTSEASLEKFIGALNYGTPPPGGDPHNIGETWSRGNRDFGLVCFVCLSDVGAGEARPLYVTASTGYERLAGLLAAANGKDVKTAPLSDPKAPYSAAILAARVAHECGHALRLGDEYGPGSGAHWGLGGPTPIYPNLQTSLNLVTTPAGTRVFDPDKIKWLWPRTIKVGVLSAAPDPLGGNDFKMRLLAGHGKPFAKDDVVLLRQAPMRSSDPFADIRFKVDRAFADSVDVIHRSGPPLDVTLFDPSIVHVLICASIAPGVELKLVAAPILAQIRASNGPLNAPAGSQGAPCAATANAAPFMTPTNLPPVKFKKAPASKADVLGIYEGGGHFDCEVFRPAGRCKMRTAEDKIVPFCHVCRYLIVDRIDPMKLADLDRMYDPHYPT